ncbi:MAG: DUF1800 family protein, partial [Stellaceae bacterium]
MQDRAFARHVIDRLGYGPRPGELDRIAATGVERWIAEQLDPASIPLPEALAVRLDAMPTLRLDPQQLFLQYGPRVGLAPGAKPDESQKMARQHRFRFVAETAIDARLVRALLSPRQLQETLGEFWSNHFNVFIGKELDRIWIGAYVEEAIRPHVLGKFRDLLFATARHPAMLLY